MSITGGITRKVELNHFTEDKEYLQKVRTYVVFLPLSTSGKMDGPSNCTWSYCVGCWKGTLNQSGVCLQNCDIQISFSYCFSNVEGALNEFTPDLVVYNAGTDILDGDPLGCLSITAEVI